MINFTLVTSRGVEIAICSLQVSSYGDYGNLFLSAAASANGSAEIAILFLFCLFVYLLLHNFGDLPFLQHFICFEPVI